jgi:hypothetical protein
MFWSPVVITQLWMEVCVCGFVWVLVCLFVFICVCVEVMM